MISAGDGQAIPLLRVPLATTCDARSISGQRCVILPAPHYLDEADDAAHQPLFPAPRESVSNLSLLRHAATAGQEVCGPDAADLEIGDSQTVGSTGGRLISGYRGGIVMAACCGSPVLALCLAHACDMRVNLQTKARTP